MGIESKVFDAAEAKAAEKLQRFFRSLNAVPCQNRSISITRPETVNGSERKLSMPKTVSYALWSLEPYSIGLKLRTLRTQKGLTLSRLAAETGLSTALLSKLETDRMIPTLPTLATITRVYGVGMSYFFAEPARHTLSITRKAYLEGDGRGPEPFKVTLLNAASENPKLVAHMIEFAPGGATSAADCFRETSGVIYVLEGRLQLETGGMEEVLETGDCACLESEMTLAWSAAGKSRCRVLAVLPARQRAGP